jgi:LysM repeat protein
VIRLPGVDETSAVTPISLPAATTTSITTGATGATAAAPVAATATTGGITYTVQPGDTLFGIALQGNVTLQALLTANNMQEDDFLQIGQVLTIPGRTTPLPATGAPAAPSLAATTATTRTTVAATGGVTTTRPVTATTATLLPAPTASTPAATTAATATTAGGPSVHVVGDGDTIITIALEYDLDWQELLALNGLGADTILQIGQQIRLR